MKWNRRADLEKDMIAYCGGAMLAKRGQVAGFLGRHPKDKKVSAYLRSVHKIDGKYPIYDLSEVIWEGGEK